MRSRSSTFPARFTASARKASSAVSELKLTSKTISRGRVPGKPPDQAGVEGTRQLVDVAGPAEGLSRLRWEAFVESRRHAVEGADVALQPADRGTVEPDDQSPFGRRQVAPRRIEQSEPELTFELPSQRGQRQQRHRDRAQAACNQTSDHSASLHA